MDVTSPLLTRGTAQLVDRDQEQRFRRDYLTGQRRTSVITAAVVLAANGVMLAYRVLAGDYAGGTASLVAHIAVLAAGIALTGVLARVRRISTLRIALVTTVLAVIAAIALLIATDASPGFHGSLLIIGGIALIYLAVPLELTRVTVLALTYTAVTFPPWWIHAPGNNDRDYVIAAVVLVHVLCLIQGSRAQRERRIHFAQRETLLELSSVDPLTQLVNRRAAGAEIERAWAAWQSSGRPISVLMIDIDHFKQLNDTQGHIAGDHALRLVADVVRGTMPAVPGQVAARYGGEEFLCLLPGLVGPDAAVVAGRILAGVRRVEIPLTAASDGRGTLTVSAGVASADAGMTQPDELIDAADQQLYRAKREGRNCVRMAGRNIPSQYGRDSGDSYEATANTEIVRQ